MYRIRTLQHPRATALAILLAVSLLCAQWIGLVHRVVHDGGLQTLSRTLYSSANATGKPGTSALWSDTFHHSCAAFDAATLGAAIDSPPFVVPVLPNLHVIASWIAFRSWEAPFRCHFSSRAPPIL